MLPRRGVYRLPPCSPGDGVRRPAGDPVVLTSVNASWKLPIPQPPSGLSLVLGDQTGAGNDRLAEAGSPTDALPHQLGFFPLRGRLLKSGSEDSGVELGSGDHVPLTPVESEKSFSLDCLDGEDSAPALQEGRPQGRPEAPRPTLGCAWRDVERKLGNVAQRSQESLTSVPKEPAPGWEELKSCHHHPCQPVRVEGALDEAPGGGSTLEEKKARAEAPQPAARPMPGPGLRSLENLSKVMERMAKLQRAHLEIQHEQQVLECRVQALDGPLGQEKCVNPVRVEGGLDEASGGCSPATSGSSALGEEEETKGEAPQPASRPLPGPGLRSLENLSKLMEKIAKLQRANLEIHHKCQVLECRIRTLEQGKNARSLWGRLKGLFWRRRRRRRRSAKPHEVIHITGTGDTRRDSTSQSRHRW